ncbi:hypothetical protein ABZ883_34470 [Streptomyces sp. NPDC046977]|uniref:hypothetical protein n=1 Tax=Streptomyces sp. NPDC046977 TaxID=3154703 RepID=UPI0033E31959
MGHLSEPMAATAKERVPKPVRADSALTVAHPGTPGGVLAMQRTIGNRAVGAMLAQARPATAVQRADPPHDKPDPAAPYVAHPAVLADCANLLTRLYATLNPATLAVLRQWKTLAIGAVVDPDDPDVTIYHWTASGNWNDPAVAAALAGLGVRRWDADAARQPRGAQGAPGDAEQRLMSGDHTLKAIAVSRPPCPDCAAALADYGHEHGQVLLSVVTPPVEREQQARAKAADAIRAAADRVRRQLELYEGEHEVQAALINEPSFTGFAGYWTNHLFNRDVPPPTIWINAYGSLLAVESALARGDIREATAHLIRARRQLLVALKTYTTWKDGIESAGTKAEVAIAAVAVAAVAAVVAGPLVVEWLGQLLGEGAVEASAEEQVAARIAETIESSDAAFLTAEEQIAEAEIQADALAEANEFYATLGH